MCDYQTRIVNNQTILAWPSILCFVFVWFVNVNAAPGAERTLTMLRQQTRELLKTEANHKDLQAKQASAIALCDMYVVLRSDRRYEDSPMLQGDAAKVRKRLMRISRRNESRLNRAKVPRPSDLETQVDQALAKISDPSASNQQSQPPLFAAGGAALDDGWQLVELIQRVIAPDFWQSQGGPGVVRYFAIKRALVVRATSDVHQQVQELLSSLR